MLSKLKKKNTEYRNFAWYIFWLVENAFLTSLKTFRWPVCVDATRLLSRKESEQPIKMKPESSSRINALLHIPRLNSIILWFKLFHSDFELLVKWKPRSLLGGDTNQNSKCSRSGLWLVFESVCMSSTSWIEAHRQCKFR